MDPLLQHVLRPAKGFLGLFVLGDIERNAVEEEGAAGVIADNLGLSMDPHDSPISRPEAVLGAEGLPEGAGHRELGMPALAVVGMEARVPKDGVFQPFFLREPEHRLDLRADIELVAAAVQCGHEGDRRDLLHERTIPDSGVANGHCGKRTVRLAPETRHDVNCGQVGRCRLTHPLEVGLGVKEFPQASHRHRR